MELPELPEPAKKELRFHAGCDVYIPDDYESYFTPDQMRAYALEAIAAERERILAALREWDYDITDESHVDSFAAAIRAQGSKA